MEVSVFNAEAGSETEDLIDFANMVFSMDNADGIDFAALLPKAYAKERCGMLFHHVVKENGRIRGLVDLYPLTIRLSAPDGLAIKAVYAGTVSVHPHTRRRGYMSRLMANAVQTALGQGCDLMLLDGNRHRYQHYGFECAGARCSFFMEKSNARHCCEEICEEPDMEASVYSFEKLEADSPCMEKLFALYLRRNVTARTMEDFFSCLQSYNAVTYAVFKGKQLAGYISLSEDESDVNEFELVEGTVLPRVIYDLMEWLGISGLTVIVGADETDRIISLQKMCNRCSFGLSHQIKILNYERVLEFLFRWKLRYCTLAESEYVIGVTGNTGKPEIKEKDAEAEPDSENYKISVSGQQVSVIKTAQKADASFEEMEFVRVLTTGLGLAERNDKLKNAPAGWFPLPFYLPDADTF